MKLGIVYGAILWAIMILLSCTFVVSDGDVEINNADKTGIITEVKSDLPRDN